MIKEKSAGGIILNKKKQLVLVRMPNDSWSFPKGHVEKGEDALTAAKREILEECGISNPELIKEIGKFTRSKKKIVDGKKYILEKTIILFLFKSNQEMLTPIDPIHPEARWVSYSDALKMLTHSEDAKFLRKVWEIEI